MTALLAALPFLLIGAALGTLHFGALGWNVALITSGGHRWTAAAVFIGRLAVTAIGFVVVARYGGLPLLFAAAGFAAVRPVMVRRAKAAS